VVVLSDHSKVELDCSSSDRSPFPALHCSMVSCSSCSSISRIRGKREQDGNGRKCPMKVINVIIQVKFYSMVVLDNTVGPF